MNLIAFSLLDNKTGHYNVPFFVNHRGHALRMVTDLAGDMNTTVGRHPMDFSLCELGTWDDASGSFANQTPINLGLVGSFLEPAQPSLSLVREG